MSSAKLFGFAINVEAEDRGGGCDASSTAREVSPLSQRDRGDYRPYTRFSESHSHSGPVSMDVEPDLRDCFINFFDQASQEINTGGEFYVNSNQRVITSGYFNIWEEDELELRLGFGSGSGLRSTMGQVRGDSGGVEVYSEIDSGHVEVGTVLTPVEDNFYGEAAMVMNEAREWAYMLHEMSRVQEPAQVSGINTQEEEEELVWFGVNNLVVDNMANSVPMDMGLAVYLANIDEDDDVDDDIYRDHYGFLAQIFDENEAEIMGSPPASKSVVDDLPFVQHQELSNENNNCAICKDEILVEERVRMLPCKHYFHGDCVIPWLKIRNTCPVCRYELPTDDLEYERNKRLQRQRSSGLASDSMLE